MQAGSLRCRVKLELARPGSRGVLVCFLTLSLLSLDLLLLLFLSLSSSNVAQYMVCFQFPFIETDMVSQGLDNTSLSAETA